MKRLSMVLSFLMIVSLVISLVISCTPKPKETVMLRLPMGQPAGDPFVTIYQEMAERFNERAGGEYEITVYPGGSLVSIMEQLDAARTGAAELGSIGMGMYSGAENRFYATEMPFLFDNIHALEAGNGPELVKLVNDEIMVEKFNQIALAAHHTEMIELISTRPVRTLEDWHGLLLGAISPGLAAYTTQMGGTAVTSTFAETYSNLEKGVTDASLESPTAMQQLKFVDVAKYVTFQYAIPTSFVITVNLDVWNAMPENIKDLLTEEVQQLGDTLNEHFTNNYLENQELLAAAGAEVYVLPKAERDRWHEVIRPYTEEQLASMGAFGTGIKQIADKCNAENP
jgi:TRAP-type C4-dicarboxylate transport system substrate-binding protein